MKEATKIIVDIGSQIEQHKECKERLHVIGYVEGRFLLLHPRDLGEHPEIFKITPTALKSGLSGREWDRLFNKIRYILKNEEICK